MQESASYLLHDGRGSVVQEVVGAASVTSWRRYTAFGEVSAGTDAHEGRFFGYDAEEQSSVTGLVYLRFRHYDPEMGRFGVADTYLGDAFDPITLNRYLYCASDPVNHVDPTGHVSVASSISAALGKAMSSVGSSVSKARRQVQLGIFGLKVKNMVDGVIAQADYAYAAFRGDWAAAARAAKMRRIYEERFRALYCGDAKYVKDSWAQMGASMHAFATVTLLLPIVSTGADWLAYVSEGNVPMTALFGFMTLSEVLTLGGTAAAGIGVKAATRVTLGAGVKVSASTERVLSTSADMGGKITNVINKGDLKITFKHGDRHASEIGLDIDEVERAIANDIAAQGVQGVHQKRNSVLVDGVEVEYRSYALGEHEVNVGTYYVKK